MPWYYYTPPGPPYDNCNDTHFTLVVGLPPGCPGANNYLCAIQAIDSAGLPIITTDLCTQIATALRDRVDTTNVKLKATP